MVTFIVSEKCSAEACDERVQKQNMRNLSNLLLATCWSRAPPQHDTWPLCFLFLSAPSVGWHEPRNPNFIIPENRKYFSWPAWKIFHLSIVKIVMFCYWVLLPELFMFIMFYRGRAKQMVLHQHNAVLQKNDWKTYNQILVIFPASTEYNVSFSIQLLHKIRSPPSLKLLVDKNALKRNYHSMNTWMCLQRIIKLILAIKIRGCTSYCLSLLLHINQLVIC